MDIDLSFPSVISHEVITGLTENFIFDSLTILNFASFVMIIAIGIYVIFFRKEK